MNAILRKIIYGTLLASCTTFPQEWSVSGEIQGSWLAGRKWAQLSAAAAPNAKKRKNRKNSRGRKPENGVQRQSPEQGNTTGVNLALLRKSVFSPWANPPSFRFVKLASPMSLNLTRGLNPDHVAENSLWTGRSLLRLAQTTHGVDVLLEQRESGQGGVRALYFTSSGEIVVRELNGGEKLGRHTENQVLRDLGFNGRVLKVNGKSLVLESLTSKGWKAGMSGIVPLAKERFVYDPVSSRTEARAIFRLQRVKGRKAMATIQFKNEKRSPVAAGDLVWVGSVSGSGKAGGG